MADKKHTEGQGDGGVFDEHEVQETHEALDTELVGDDDTPDVGESTPLRGHCNALTGRVVVLEKQMDRLSLAIYGLASFVFGLLVGSWFFIHWLKLR